MEAKNNFIAGKENTPVDKGGDVYSSVELSVFLGEEGGVLTA